MKHTPMQNLKKDLELTILTSKASLDFIEDENIKNLCQKVVLTTINSIIKRINEHSIQEEKQNIIDAFYSGMGDEKILEFEAPLKYYNKTFKRIKQQK